MKGDRDEERPFICSLDRANPGSFNESPSCVSEAQALGHLPLWSRAHWQESSVKVEQTGLKPVHCGMLMLQGVAWSAELQWQPHKPGLFYVALFTAAIWLQSSQCHSMLLTFTAFGEINWKILASHKPKM